MEVLPGTGRALGTRGWLRLRRFVEPALRSRLQKAADLAWLPLAPRVGRVTQAGRFAQLAMEDAPEHLRQEAAGLLDSLAADLGPARLRGFNEVTWQKYLAESGHIDPHRDQVFHVGVIAIVTLAGSAPFSVLAQRQPPIAEAEWITEPGGPRSAQRSSVWTRGSPVPVALRGVTPSGRAAHGDIPVQSQVKGPAHWRSADDVW